ncbi:MAG TPA: hypothetical protein VNV65_00295 [Candidatus Solibacter sp.]|nr:hypothetical protein [Candidatus Solibacter sp.]
MSGDPRGDEDHEPELRAGARAPVKKSLGEFLAEFERRLTSHPDLPATGAMRLVEERAAGLRRSPFESEPGATPEPATDAAEAGREAPGAPSPTGTATGEDPVEPAPAAEGTPETAAATPGELRRLRGRRRRKHRHRAH